MKKLISILSILLLLAAPALSQRILHSNYNGFTGAYQIETSIVSLKGGYSSGFGVAFRAYNKNLFLSLVGYGKSHRAVGEDERLQFIMKDGSSVRFMSRVQLPANETAIPNIYIHHYIISPLEVKALTKSPVSILRKFSTDGYTDIPIKQRQARDLVELCQLFLKEINKF